MVSPAETPLEQALSMSQDTALRGELGATGGAFSGAWVGPGFAKMLHHLFRDPLSRNTPRNPPKFPKMRPPGLQTP